MASSHCSSPTNSESYDSDGDVAMLDRSPEPEVQMTTPAMSERLSFVPNSAQLDHIDLLDISCHRRLPSKKPLAMYEYKDVNGVLAVQPAGDYQNLMAYFAPLLPSENGCDPLLRLVRLWCCEAQGIKGLQDEVRWTLTFIFDFVNIMLCRQAASGCLRGSTAFYRMRCMLLCLLAVSNDLSKLYNVNLRVPQPACDDT